MTDATWMPDDASEKCLVCDTTFGRLSNRKHHCRLCGRLVCSGCLGLGETPQLYLTGPGQSETSLVPPLSPLKCLTHPNASMTRTAVSAWIPQTLRRHTHIDPVAPKLCMACGVTLARERAAWTTARALCFALPLLSEGRQRMVLCTALQLYEQYNTTRKLTHLTGFAVLGRWVATLANLKFYCRNVRSLSRFPFMRQLMLILYSHWYIYADAPQSYITHSETSTILTLMLNRAHSKTEVDPSSNADLTKKPRPPLMLSTKRLKALLKNTANATHFLIGHQLLHYLARVKEPIIRNCWNSLFSETESLALFMHNRLCCSTLCMSKQTNAADVVPYNGMFMDFFDFLKLRLKRVPSSRNPPTYKQAVCALLHNAMYCQPHLAQGCAHVLHVDLATVNLFYGKCFESLWAVTQGNPFIPVTANPLITYDPRIQIIRHAENPSLKPKTLATQPRSPAQLVHLGSTILMPIYEPLYAYAIQHLVRLFYRTSWTHELASAQSDLEQRAHKLCSSLNLFFGPDSMTTGETVGHVKASVLNFGSLQLIDPEPTKDLSLSVLAYLVMYFILTMRDMLGPSTAAPRGLPVIVTMPDEALLVVPYTLRACLDTRAHLCNTPITDTVMAEVKRVTTRFVDHFLPEIWMAFYPLSRTLDRGEDKLYAYFNHLEHVMRTDTFRSSFLNLVF